MDHFLSLIKKKLIGEASLQETEELNRLLHKSQEHKELYETVFTEALVNDEIDWLAAEQAYAAHYVKMQLKKQFDE